jgi:hypothetical protein
VHLRSTVVDHIGASTCAQDKVCRAGRERNHGFLKVLRVSQRHTSGPKAGEVSNHFSQPRYAHVLIMSYPGLTSGPSFITFTPSTYLLLTVPAGTYPLLISHHLCHLAPHHLHPSPPHLPLVWPLRCPHGHLPSTISCLARQSPRQLPRPTGAELT